MTCLRFWALTSAIHHLRRLRRFFTSNQHSCMISFTWLINCVLPLAFFNFYTNWGVNHSEAIHLVFILLSFQSTNGSEFFFTKFKFLFNFKLAVNKDNNGVPMWRSDIGKLPIFRVLPLRFCACFVPIPMVTTNAYLDVEKMTKRPWLDTIGFLINALSRSRDKS